jgi:hypothetical protein
MKRIAAFFLATSFAAQPVFADTLLDSGKRAVENQVQAGGFETSGGGNSLLVPGVVLMAAGGTMAVLGTTVLKSKGDEYDACVFVVDVLVGFEEGDCDEAKETNKALLWGGIGAAGAGAALTAIGASNSSVTFGRGRFGFQQKIKF